MQLVFMHFLVPLCPPRGKTEYKYRTIGKRLGVPGDSDDKESACSVGDLDLIPRLGRFPGEGHGNPLQYSCLENPMDRGTWRATIHRVPKSQTQPKRLSTQRIHKDKKSLEGNRKHSRKETPHCGLFVTFDSCECVIH